MQVTKPHKASQLTTEQENAIDALILGGTDREVAEQVGVTRETVTRWRNVNADFGAELNRRRHALWASSHDRLRAMVGKALGVLEGALDRGDARAAVEVLKAAQVYGQVGAPKGPEDADLIRLEEARAWARVEALKQSGGDVLYATIAEQDLIAQRFGELQAQGQG